MLAERLGYRMENEYAAISPSKANRLFWLGRYAERVYMSLHLLRKYYDTHIDGDKRAYCVYCEKLNIPHDGDIGADFIQSLLYSVNMQGSLLSGLKFANDNAIVVREEITSETLSYIHLAVAHMRDCAARGDTNITALQPITDYLLAFWGSAEERIYGEPAYNIMKCGKAVEKFDMRIRFDYSYTRILESYAKLRNLVWTLERSYSPSVLEELDLLMSVKEFSLTPHNKQAILSSISRLITI